MQRPSWQRACAAMLAHTFVAHAVNFNLGDQASTKSAAATIAYNMMVQYTGNVSGQVPGILPNLGQIPNGYFWWEGGEMFGAMVDYWMYTGDSSYNPTVAMALAFQAGDSKDYFPRNQTFDEGNDDQAFWAMAALTAAEMKFESPPNTAVNQGLTWIGGAQAVYEQQNAAWETATCAGGIRWAKQPTGTGWNQKTTIANLGFMNVAARLGLYLKNQSYLDAAGRTYDWVKSVNLIDDDSGAVYDGVSVGDNCSTTDQLRWTYNAGAALQGAAAMWNATSDQKWHQEVDTLMKGVPFFFENGVIKEQNCEDNPLNTPGGCSMDQKSFKNVLIKALAVTAKYCPWTSDTIQPMLGTTAVAAANACVCGDSKTQCPLKWIGDPNANCNGDYGIGQHMCALEAIISTLNPFVGGPVTQATGGTSQSDPNAGKGPLDPYEAYLNSPITTGDKAGAAILTMLITVPWLAGTIWLLWP